jgi:sigma-B regulation protein RsbU (phosphoserine phosphatase)
MSAETRQIQDLQILNDTVEALNQAVDMRSVLNDALAKLVEAMGLETGWIMLKEPEGTSSPEGGDLMLTAHYNLPPALKPDRTEVWSGTCECQGRCKAGRLTEAYNAVLCSRLAGASGEHQGLAVHASTSLRSGEQVLGILNVAASDWSSFQPEALDLLGRIGVQIGLALERARSFDQLRERRSMEQAALLEFSERLLGQRSRHELIDYLVQAVRRMFDLDASAVLVPTQQPDVLRVLAASGWRVNPVTHERRFSVNGGGGLALPMRSREPLLVKDLEQLDADNQVPDWIRDEGFRGHATIPLVAEGSMLGALMVDVRHPRLFTTSELRLLSLFANQAAMTIESRRLQRQQAVQQRMEDELAVGRQIQLSLLPHREPAVAGWEFAVYYQAAHQVGGDFYDFVEWPDAKNRLGLVVADVVGKGVPAALFMALSRTTIRSAALVETSPLAALTKANSLLLQESRSDMFLTAFYGMLDTETGRLVYANAGHNRPLWLRAATGEVQELPSWGTILGSFQEIAPEEREVGLAPGDLLVLYTDGLSEAFDARGRQFGTDRLRNVVAAHPSASARTVLDEVIRAVNEFAGDVSLSDDLTLLVTRRET